MCAFTNPGILPGCSSCPSSPSTSAPTSVCSPSEIAARSCPGWNGPEPDVRLQPIEFYVAGEERSSLFAGFKSRDGRARPQPCAPNCVISFPCSDIDDVLERNRRPLQKKGSQLALINAHGLWKRCATNALTLIAHALEWAADDNLRLLQSLEKSSADHHSPQSRGHIA